MSNRGHRLVPGGGRVATGPNVPPNPAAVAAAAAAAATAGANPATTVSGKPKTGRPKVPTSKPKGQSTPKYTGAGIAVGGVKRARAAGRGEPDAKRHKPITGAAAAAVNAAQARNVATAAAAANAAANGQVNPGAIPPQSPSGSSRSRSRKHSAKKSVAAVAAAAVAAAAAGGGNATGLATATASGHSVHLQRMGLAQTVGSHVSVSATGVGGPGGATAVARRNPRVTPASRSNPPPPPPSNFVSVAGIPMPGNVRTTTINRRFFGQEIQCLMHAFGEVRFCARDVLEIMEDTVREYVRQVAIQAADRALDIAECTGVNPQMSKSRVVVTVPHVAHTLRRDPRAIQRLNACFEPPTPKPGSESAAAAEKRKAVPARARPAEATWELVREMGLLPDMTDTREPALNHNPTWSERLTHQQDIFLACSFRAALVFQKCMSKSAFQDLYSCRSVTLTKQESRSRAPILRGKSRLTLFREWIDLGTKENVSVPDDTLYALGQVAWEAIGTITQTALLHRHFDEIAQGRGDPRAHEWSIGRHVLAAIGFGIAQAVKIPLTDSNGYALHEEIERISTSTLAGAARWRGYPRISSPCLLPSHIREAARRMERPPDDYMGFPSS